MTRGSQRNVDKDPGWVERRFREVENQIAALFKGKLPVVPGAPITIQQLLTDPNSGTAYEDSDTTTATADDVSVTLVLSYLPIARSLNVYQNGVRLALDEFSRADNIVTIPPSSTLVIRADDVFDAWYVRDTLAPTPAVTEGSAYDEAVLAEATLLGYWRLAETSGLVMEDSSGNGRHGTYTVDVDLGGAALLVGDPDLAAHFPHAGGAPRGVVPSASWMNVPTFTIECWMAVDSISSGLQCLVSRDTQGRSWIMRMNSGGDLQFSKIQSGAVDSIAAGAGLDDLDAHYVVSTYDGSNFRLYVDGALMQTTAATGDPSTVADLAVGATYAGDVTWWTPQYFKGRLSKVAFYSGAQSLAQIQNRYAIGTGA